MKLSIAQAELQACEAHLAQHEKELEEKRVEVVRDLFGGRIRVSGVCGEVWVQVGRGELGLGAFTFPLPFRIPIFTYY
jgi:hypothetical protein